MTSQGREPISFAVNISISERVIWSKELDIYTCIIYIYHAYKGQKEMLKSLMIAGRNES